MGWRIATVVAAAALMAAAATQWGTTQSTQPGTDDDGSQAFDANFGVKHPLPAGVSPLTWTAIPPAMELDCVIRRGDVYRAYAQSADTIALASTRGAVMLVDMRLLHPRPADPNRLDPRRGSGARVIGSRD
jgi:hypothetical protein